MTTGASSSGGMTERTWMPAIEVNQGEGNYMIRAELPGLRPEDVNVEITDDAIVISGERKEEKDEERRGVHITEHRYGEFYRSIPLPEGAQTDMAKASFENGVLEINVPIQQTGAERRRIPVETGSASGGGSSQSAGSEKAA
jgi:HSP20 family protein